MDTTYVSDAKIREGEQPDAAALKQLVRAAVALNQLRVRE
jgi:hypothetical protein